MLILSRVCAEFHDAKGVPLFSVTPSTRNIFTEAPEAIREDPLFRMLISDGSLEAAVPEERKRLLENEPMTGVAADGRSEADAVPPAKPGKTAKSAKAAPSPAESNSP